MGVKSGVTQAMGFMGFVGRPEWNRGGPDRRSERRRVRRGRFMAANGEPSGR